MRDNPHRLRRGARSRPNGGAFCMLYGPTMLCNLKLTMTDHWHQRVPDPPRRDGGHRLRVDAALPTYLGPEVRSPHSSTSPPEFPRPDASPARSRKRKALLRMSVTGPGRVKIAQLGVQLRISRPP